MTSRAKRLSWPTHQERGRRRDLKRDAVLDAAVKSFNERGYHSTSIDDVAASLRVTKPTVYYYFANKDEILFECVKLGLESVLGAANAADASGGGIERLTALMRNYAVAMTQDFGMCVIRTADHELSAEARVQLRMLKREIDDTVRQVVEDGMREGWLQTGNPRLVTFTIIGALNWIARWFDPQGCLSRDEVVEGVVTTLVAGLAPVRGGRASKARGNKDDKGSRVAAKRPIASRRVRS